MMNRIAPLAPLSAALTSNEIAVLDQLGENGKCHDRPLADYLLMIARLGRYLARKTDPPPGNMVIWRGGADWPISQSARIQNLWVIEGQTGRLRTDGGLAFIIAALTACVVVALP